MPRRGNGGGGRGGGRGGNGGKEPADDPVGRPPGSGPLRTLAIWCPDWPVVAAIQSAQSGQSAQAAQTGVTQGAGGGSGDIRQERFAAVVFANRVIACSAGARMEGVRRGQRRREAQSRVPDLEIYPHDPARDARVFEPVVAAVEELVPGVEILRPGLAIVRAQGATRYFGTETRVGRVVAAAVRDTGHDAKLGIADGSFAAVQAAYQTAHQVTYVQPEPLVTVQPVTGQPVTGQPVTGQPATVPPVSVPPVTVPMVIVPSGGAADFLAPLPVAVLEDSELADLLVRLGIRTLGDFAALPADDVLARFGTDGLRRHTLARGLGERPPTGRPPPLDLTVATELDPPVERVDAATFAAKALAEQLAEQLMSRALACTRIRIEAQTENGEELARVWRHDDGFTTVAIAERVRWQLDGWLSGSVGDRARGGATPTAGVTLLRLVPVEIVDAGRQLGLWGDTAESQERVERAVDRVLGLLGPDAVTTAVLSGGRDLAERVRLVPWGESRAPDPADALPWPGRVPAPSPATVLSAPLPAEVLAADGTPVGVTGRLVVTAEPNQLVLEGGRPVEVVGWAGPWAVDTRWWDAARQRRRARFQVVTSDERALLLVLEDGRWWVEAAYD